MSLGQKLFDRTPVSRGGFSVRRLREEELEELLALERRAFRHPWSPDLIRRELRHDWSTILVAREEASDVLVGHVIFWLVSDEIHILNIAVDPGHRRKGIARLLLTEVLDRCRGRGFSVATLEVRRSNEPAIALYLGLGFRQVGVRKGYYAEEQEDAIVMVLDL